MNKTHRVLEVEKKIGMTLEDSWQNLYWNQGKSMQEVADAWGVEQSTAWNWVKLRLGLKFRGKKSAQEAPGQAFENYAKKPGNI